MKKLLKKKTIILRTPVLLMRDCDTKNPHTCDRRKKVSGCKRCREARLLKYSVKRFKHNCLLIICTNWPFSLSWHFLIGLKTTANRLSDSAGGRFLPTMLTQMSSTSTQHVFMSVFAFPGIGGLIAHTLVSLNRSAHWNGFKYTPSFLYSVFSNSKRLFRENTSI